MKRPAFFSAILFAMAFALAAEPLSAQTPLTVSPEPSVGSGAQKVVSPQILRGGKVTFRIEAPTAPSVQLVVGTANADQGKYDLTKGPDGIWSVTIGPVKPESYPYRFVIGGAAVNAGLVDIPGVPPLFYETRNVPHGSINNHAYFSTVQNRRRQLAIYVPPQYYTEPKRAFPVLYLWSVNPAGVTAGGVGEWVPEWVRERRLSDILDNLIADKKAVPMIAVVMELRLAPGVRKYTLDAEHVFGKEIGADIIPFVESHYRTLPGRQNRAMAGASVEGVTTYEVGLQNIDKFANLGLFSAGMFGGTLEGPTTVAIEPYEPDKLLPGLSQTLRSPAASLKVFYLSDGTLDAREPFDEKAVADFGKFGVHPVFKTFDGGHQDKVWRYALADFASLLFR